MPSLSDPDLAALLAALPDEDVPGALGQLLARLLRSTGQQSEAARAPDLQPYTLEEASRVLRKSTVWTRRKAKRGEVPGAHKVGRAWIFDRAPFDRWRGRPEVG